MSLFCVPTALTLRLPQIRQKVEHKRTFLFLEQLILKVRPRCLALSRRCSA
jgi:hypothetical protein